MHVSYVMTTWMMLHVVKLMHVLMYMHMHILFDEHELCRDIIMKSKLKVRVTCVCVRACVRVCVYTHSQLNNAFSEL